MALREGYLHDYLVASLLGVGFGMVMAVPASYILVTTASFNIFWPIAGFVGLNWGTYIGGLAIAGIFGFIPGGLIAGYINFRLHRMGDNLEMAGLSSGFFTAFVFMILQLVSSLTYAILNTGAAGTIFIGWALSTVFGFMFFTLGGYFSGMLERKPFAMLRIFDLSQMRRGQEAPPPPPGSTATTCPSCGSPLRYIQQYQRWYCDKEKKYV
jgi:hypothetical protein